MMINLPRSGIAIGFQAKQFLGDKEEQVQIEKLKKQSP
jgi:hypothetical protein